MEIDVNVTEYILWKSSETKKNRLNANVIRDKSVEKIIPLTNGLYCSMLLGLDAVFKTKIPITVYMNMSIETFS